MSATPTIHEIYKQVSGLARQSKLLFPRMLRWETGIETIEGAEFNLGADQHILLPVDWLLPLQIWARTVVDDHGLLISPHQIENRGYVFSPPGEPENVLTEDQLAWMLLEERDHRALLYAIAEASILHQTFRPSWYETPLPPCAARFLRWYRGAGLHSDGTLPVATSATRGWLSRFGPQVCQPSEDPFRWSSAFAQAGAHGRYAAVKLWEEEWLPWFLNQYGTDLPHMPGLPAAVIQAYAERPAQPGACWTSEQLSQAQNDPALRLLLRWATANGAVAAQPRVTPYLPRFAGGDAWPKPGRLQELLETPWDYEGEIAVIKRQGRWWDRPQLTHYYPTKDVDRLTGRSEIRAGKARGQLLTFEPALPVYGGFAEEAEEHVLLRVPARYAQLAQTAVQQLILGEMQQREERHINREEATPPLPHAPPELKWNKGSKDQKSALEEKPKRQRRRGVEKPVKEAEAEMAPVVDFPPSPPPFPEAPSPPVPVPRRSQQERTATPMTAEEAILGGWGQRVWLSTYRRQEGVPNPYALAYEQRNGKLPSDHPHFTNGNLVPPEWLPKLSLMYQMLGMPSAADKLNIEGLEAYLSVVWTAEGAKEWEDAMLKLGVQPGGTVQD